MIFSDIGITIEVNLQGENTCVVKILTENHGLYRLVVRNAKNSFNKYRSLLHPGNLVSVEWSSTSDNMLPVLRELEVLKSYHASIVICGSQKKLHYLSAIFPLVLAYIPERELIEGSFYEVKNLLDEFIVCDEETYDFSKNINILKEYFMEN